METNKTIYMTYKKEVPLIVFNRWKRLNPSYRIELSLDKECISFLHNHINDYVARLFINIRDGRYKADLWRLCKLYIHGGVYADVDLVPYINIENLNKKITFYTCITPKTKSMFQAFIVNFSKPRNNLILIFITSFLMNKAYLYTDSTKDPIYDMYECIKYNLNGQEPQPLTQYDLEEVKLKIRIGTSNKRVKKIPLCYFPSDVNYTVRMKETPDEATFEYEIANHILTITRTDADSGWSYPYTADICIPSKESIYLFEESFTNHDYLHAKVTIGPRKILDSRDVNYAKRGGW
jgi:hypothetical protein